jgi:two-component system, LytTR family, sensor kinase
MKRRWTWWLLYALGLTVCGCLNGWSSYAAASTGGRYYGNWMLVVSWDLINWVLWLPLTPFILWLARKFKFNCDRGSRTVWIYLLAGIVLSLTHLILQLAINFGLIYGFRAFSAFITYRAHVLYSSFLVGLFVYGLILAVALALNYYEQYRQEELRASQLATALAQSQLQALKMQLHPHFLFNTLNSITALQLVDVRAAQKMMAQLGDFLRMTLDNAGTQEVTLKEEIEFLDCYLQIERTRFDKRLTTRLEIDPETLDAKVPNLILQPIVENAILHGIAPRLARGEISIAAKRKNGKLRIQIRDNGEGLPEHGPVPKEGVGLSNTRSRLEHLYGDQASLAMANAVGGGLIVTVEIPFTP